MATVLNDCNYKLTKIILSKQEPFTLEEIMGDMEKVESKIEDRRDMKKIVFGIMVLLLNMVLNILSPIAINSHTYAIRYTG